MQEKDAQERYKLNVQDQLGDIWFEDEYERQIQLMFSILIALGWKVKDLQLLYSRQQARQRCEKTSRHDVQKWCKRKVRQICNTSAGWSWG